MTFLHPGTIHCGELYAKKGLKRRTGDLQRKFQIIIPDDFQIEAAIWKLNSYMREVPQGEQGELLPT